MRRQKGFTLIELLIVVAIIGIVAVIAIPSLVRARNEGVTSTFQKHFGVDLRPYATSEDPALWLDDGQKAALRPLVTKQLAETCVPYQASEPFNVKPSTDPAEVTRQLALIQVGRDPDSQAENIKQQCTEARHVVARLGLATEVP